MRKSVVVGILAAMLSLSTSARASDPNSSSTELADLQSKFSKIAEKVTPSVVSISVALDKPAPDDFLRPSDTSNRALTDFLSKTTRMVGTGFAISSDGLILTNEHVVSDAVQIWCTTDDGRVFPAFVVGSDPRSDLAVLKLPTDTLKPVNFAHPSTIRRGNWTIALGNPLGLAGEGHLAMSVGVISATGRSLPRLSAREGRLYTDLIQTTAEINPGNSGGPLFDIDARVVGINSAVILPQKTTNGIGFAIPVSAALLNHIDELKQGKEIHYGDLDLTVAEPTPSDRAAAGLTFNAGVRIAAIPITSPCAGDLRPGDLLLSVNDAPVADIDAYSIAAAALRSDSPVRLSVWRSGKLWSTFVHPAERKIPAVTTATQTYHWNHMTLGATPEGIQVLKADKDAPYKPGTLLTAFDGQNITTIAALQATLASGDPKSLATLPH